MFLEAFASAAIVDLAQCSAQVMVEIRVSLFLLNLCAKVSQLNRMQSQGERPVDRMYRSITWATDYMPSHTNSLEREAAMEALLPPERSGFWTLYSDITSRHIIELYNIHKPF